MRAVISRRVDDLGRIVLPKEMREREEIREGTPLDILMNDAGDIILRKSLCHCVHCGSTGDPHYINSRMVCGKCLKQMALMQAGG